MRLLIGVSAVAGLAMATGAMAQSLPGDVNGFPAAPGQAGSQAGSRNFGTPPCCDPRSPQASFNPGMSAGTVQSMGQRGAPTSSAVVPTRYEASLQALQAQIDRQAQLDGGQLTPKHAAEFQQALDDTNRHFHKGPYARP
jgi:hypothetical protein